MRVQSDGRKYGVSQPEVSPLISDHSEHYENCSCTLLILETVLVDGRIKLCYFKVAFSNKI